MVLFYWHANNGSMGSVGSDETDAYGVASVPWIYPDSGVFVFWAHVSAGQQVMSSPVMLTVGKETGLSMSVAWGSGFDYTISGRLLYGGVGVGGKQVAVKVNGTVEAVVTTASDGGYAVTLLLPAVDDMATNYQVEAVFYGDNALNLTGLAALPNGTQYAACTTLQYFGYKPASNVTWLTVEPQSTQVMQQTKTPEQMQQEAENNGWLKPPEPRFSWWYPWFRLHFVMVYADADILDVGLSPLGGDIVIPYPPLDSWILDAINEIIIEPIAQTYLIGWLASEITLFLAMYAGPAGFVGGLLISLGTKELLFRTASNSGLKGAFVGALFSWAYGFLATLAQVSHLGVATLSEFLGISELNFWKLLYKFIYVPVNMVYLIRMIFRLIEAGIW